MNAREKFTAQNLHSYIDGDLSSQEKNAFERAIHSNDELKDEVCEIRKIKQQVLEHYQQVEIPPLVQMRVKPRRYWGANWTMAASFFLAFGLGFVLSSQMQWAASPSVSPSMLADNIALPKKVVLHISSDNPDRVQALLKTANALLQQAHGASEKPEVEIVANDHGIDLFDQKNRNRAEIIEMLKKYDNLKLLACKRALERRVESGHPVKLISNVESDRTAVDEIVDKMQQGWRYYKF